MTFEKMFIISFVLAAIVIFTEYSGLGVGVFVGGFAISLYFPTEKEINGERRKK